MPEKWWKTTTDLGSVYYSEHEQEASPFAMVEVLTVRNETEERDLQEQLAAARQLVEITKPYTDCLRVAGQKEDAKNV